MKVLGLPPAHPAEFPPRSVSHLPLPSHLRGSARALYAVAGAMVAIPLFQVAPRILPVDLLSSAWRYLAYSAISGTVLAPMGGVVLAHWVAAIANDRPRQAALALVCLAGGISLLVTAPVFLYDYLALRDEAMSAMRGAIDSAAWRALFGGLVSGLALVIVGASGWRSAWTPVPGQIRKKGGNGGLVVAQNAPLTEVGGALDVLVREGK